MDDRLKQLHNYLEKMNQVNGEEDGYYLQLFFDGSGTVYNFDEDEIFSFNTYEEAIEEFETFLDANEYDSEDVEDLEGMEDIDDEDTEDYYDSSVKNEDDSEILSDFS